MHRLDFGCGRVTFSRWGSRRQRRIGSLGIDHAARAFSAAFEPVTPPPRHRFLRCGQPAGDNPGLLHLCLRGRVVVPARDQVGPGSRTNPG
jgi:hypothetical protein